MQQRSTDGRGRDARTVQRAIVLQVLRDDHEQRWSRMALAREIPDFEPAAIERALTRLVRDGVVSSERDRVCASRAARCLDELELIGV